MIQLSNGHKMEYVVASGALGFDGEGWLWEQPLIALGLIKPQLFTVFIKSLTRHYRKGYLRWSKPWECVRLIRGGSVNKVGLTNPGIEKWEYKYGRLIDFERVALGGSIFGNREELVEMALILNHYDFVALEINYSCPNTGHATEVAEEVVESVKAVKRVSRHPLIVKVAVNQKYLYIAERLQGIVEGISLNSVSWEIVFPGLKSPLFKLEKKVGGGGGGVSGKPAQFHNWRAVKELVDQGAIPVIAPSIMDYRDLLELKYIGAQAFSFGAIHLKTPWKPTQIVEKYQALHQ